MAKIATITTTTEANGRDAATSTKFARASEQGAEAVHVLADRARDLASAASNPEAPHRAANPTTDYGRIALDLLGEQTRHNMHAATVIGQAIDWAGITSAQYEFISGSFERMNRFTAQYRAMVKLGVSTMSVPGRR